MAAQLAQVSPAITDSVTQANVKVLGDAPAQAAGTLYQSISQSLGLAAGNGVTFQQQTNVVHQAATTMAVAALYALGPAIAGEAASAILNDPK